MQLSQLWARFHGIDVARHCSRRVAGFTGQVRTTELWCQRRTRQSGKVASGKGACRKCEV